MRKLKELQEAEQEFFDRVWYDRSRMMSSPADIKNGAMKARFKVEEIYGKENLGPYTEFEWGMINGKLSALRWVMGDEWDFLDT